MTHTENLTCEDVHTGPAMTSRVFHWEHLPPQAQDIIKDTINEAIERELPKHINLGSDIIDAEVVVQVTIHTQIAEY